MKFALIYKPPCGVWYVHSHKLYDDREAARAAATKFLNPGTAIAIVPLDVSPTDVEFVQWK